MGTLVKAPVGGGEYHGWGVGTLVKALMEWRRGFSTMNTEAGRQC